MCDFFRDFMCNFLFLEDVNECISYGCANVATFTSEQSQLSTRSHLSKEENCSKNRTCKRAFRLRTALR